MIARAGAWCSVNFDRFSLKSKTMAMECYKVHMENGIELPIPREKYRKVRESYFKVMGEM